MVIDYNEVHGAIVALLEAARRAATRNVNALMSAAYWAIGRHIVELEQGGAARAGYGDALLKRLSADLTARFGRGFSERNLEQMRLFYLGWPISQTPSAKLRESGLASQTASAQSKGDVASDKEMVVNETAISPGDLATLARRFALPWSTYVRLF